MYFTLFYKIELKKKKKKKKFINKFINIQTLQYNIKIDN